MTATSSAAEEAVLLRQQVMDDRTVVPIREYVEREAVHLSTEIKHAEESHKELHVALQRAIDKGEEQQVDMVNKALAAIDKRLEGMNEFRKSLEDVTRDAVSRDLFDIVVNRVTIVENTYVKKEDNTKDVQALAERHKQDLDQRDFRIAALERDSVRSETLQASKASDDKARDDQAAEIARTRKSLVYAIIAGGALIVINLLVNVLQSSPTVPTP